MQVFSLAGKVAVVTGGAQGLGQAMAFSLAEAGAVIVIADINQEQGEGTVSALRDAGFEAVFMLWMWPNVVAWTIWCKLWSGNLVSLMWL